MKKNILKNTLRGVALPLLALIGANAIAHPGHGNDGVSVGADSVSLFDMLTHLLFTPEHFVVLAGLVVLAWGGIVIRKKWFKSIGG